MIFASHVVPDRWLPRIRIVDARASGVGLLSPTAVGHGEVGAGEVGAGEQGLNLVRPIDQEGPDIGEGWFAGAVGVDAHSPLPD